MRGTNGLHKSKHLGIHDSDYFIEVSATNKAMLKTTQTVKVIKDINSQPHYFDITVIS